MLARRTALLLLLALAFIAGCGDEDDDSGGAPRAIDLGVGAESIAGSERLAYGYDHLWVSTAAGVVRVDGDGDDARTVAPDAGLGPIAAGEGAVWRPTPMRARSYDRQRQRRDPPARSAHGSALGQAVPRGRELPGRG